MEKPTTGGTVEVAYRAAQAAIQMLHDAGRLRPEPMPWSEFVLGVECGGSDGSSGIVSNPVTGRLADRVIDAGGTVIMSETLERLGGEEDVYKRQIWNRAPVTRLAVRPRRAPSQGLKRAW